jgi:geranylgeranyl reductase family protein
MYDVAVIGGGPIGSRVAYRLSEMGRRVVVMEQKESLGEPVCCTGIISQKCLEQFEIDKRVVYRQANSAKVFSPSAKLISLRRQKPQACIVDRAAFNVSLARRAQDEGAEYLLNSPVTSVKVGDDGVTIESGRQPGELDRFEAKAVVMAGGSGSKLVDELGLGRVGDFTIGVQAEVETNGLDEVEVYLGRQTAPAFFAWLVPTSHRRALAGLLSRRRSGFYLNKLVSSLAAQGKIVSTEVKPSYAKVPLKPLARTYSDRIIVVGSAAGQVKPTTGGGIYFGLMCADIAADHLQQALEDDHLSAKHLSNYEKAWKKKLTGELRAADWGRKFFALLSDRQIDRVFDIMKTNGVDEALLKADDLSFDWPGKAVLRIMGHRALSRTVETIKLPLPPGRVGRGRS